MLGLGGCGKGFPFGGPNTGESGDDAKLAQIYEDLEEEGFTKEELDLREAVFRYLFLSEQAGEVVFLSFSQISAGKEDELTNPPVSFLERFDNAGLDVRAASGAVLTPGPVTDPDRPRRHVYDPLTGRAATVYWVEVVEGPEKGEAKVEAGGYRAPKGAWGFTWRFEKRGRQWYVGEQIAKWRT